MVQAGFDDVREHADIRHVRCHRTPQIVNHPRAVERSFGVELVLGWTPRDDAEYEARSITAP
jgi:hypothetical protein